jgi:hypothetical protein
MTTNYKDKYEEYHSKFWKIYHEKKELSKENRKLMLRLDIYEKKIFYGEIKRISHHGDYGILTNSEYGDIFFHSSQCKFNISNHLLSKKVKFNLTITKKLEAINVELILGDISNVFDILESGIYKSGSLQIDEISEDTSSDNISDDNTSDDNSANMLLNNGLNDNILPEDNYEEDLKMIHNSRKIWYMNFRTWPHDDKKANENWLNLIDNGFVCTWQKDNSNTKLFEKLLMGDIIAWYVIGKGYGAILKVKGDCSFITDDDLKIWHTTEESLKTHHEWAKKNDCRIIKIPVEFLAYTKIDKSIKKMKGWQKEDWTSGFRGPNAISPKHPRWREQVMKMYKEMK